MFRCQQQKKISSTLCSVCAMRISQSNLTSVDRVAVLKCQALSLPLATSIFSVPEFNSDQSGSPADLSVTCEWEPRSSSRFIDHSPEMNMMPVLRVLAFTEFGAQTRARAC